MRSGIRIHKSREYTRTGHPMGGHPIWPYLGTFQKLSCRTWVYPLFLRVRVPGSLVHYIAKIASRYPKYQTRKHNAILWS